jgi:signal transduction histidine kinase
LAICERIVTHYNGRIWVESEPGNGTCFYFTLPAAKQAGQGA